MSEPKCPHCGYEFDAEDIWHTGGTNFPVSEDGEEKQTRCWSCDEPLLIVLNLEHSWKFIDEDGEEIE